MAYKITKYKGKTKIKDTKTGKSADIDIEKFMNGGYKSITEFNEGGECPEGDVECMERQRLNLPPSVSQDLEGFNPQNPILNTPLQAATSQFTGSQVNSPIVDEDTNPNRVTPVSTVQPQGIAPSDEIVASLAPNTLGEMNSESADVDVNENQAAADYTIPNPYAGVDIPTAAYTLGQSIEDKNTLGTVTSSLKLLTGLGRNVASGLGQQNRYNQVMKDYYEKQKNERNPVQYFAHGGKKDEELATGEYMHGVKDEEREPYNAEIEQGEYFQTNEGDIAEVVGDKHSSGGEKIQMEEEDRVLSDQLKLGAKTAKMLSSKYDLKLKAKHTYSDVLDKFRKKMKLDKLVEEEAELLKKVADQDKVNDTATKNFNLQVLAKKRNEIQLKKDPIEEQRKEMFDELFNLQEESKSGGKKTDKFNEGGEKDKKKLTQEDADNINEDTGADFTVEGANELFELAPELVGQPTPDFNLGKYDGLQYFDLNYENDEFTVVPTKNNPGNESKYREYIKYLQKQNPELKISNRGYVPFNRRLEYGGRLGELAKEYNIPLERAQQLVQEFAKGGKKVVPKYAEGVKVGDIDPVTGKKVTKEEAEQKVDSGEWEYIGRGRYVDRGTPGSTRVSGQALRSYAATWDKEKFPKFEDYVAAAEQWKKDNPNWNQGRVENIPGTPDQFFYTEETPISTLPSQGINPVEITAPLPSFIPSPTQLEVPGAGSSEEIQPSPNLGGAFLFPDESPLPPSALQGTIKAERRFDRVRPTEIDAEPYLQDIKDREEAQVQSLEGLSPNVRAAVLANMRANSQKAESDVRNQIDTQNLASQEKTIYTNAQIQQREENASEQDRLSYEQRQYRAQALTDNDINNYFNQLQAMNKQRFMDIHNLNLINATNEDVYFDGQTFRRKNSDRDILRQIKV